MNLETRVRLSLRSFDMACGAVIAVSALYFIRSVLRGAQEKPKVTTDAAARVLDDGFGNVWTKCHEPECGLEIVRPGKAQCERCMARPLPSTRTLDQAYTTMYDSPDGTLDKWVR